MKYFPFFPIFISVLALSGCGHHLIPIHLVKVENRLSINETVETFYASSNPEDLGNAVKQALHTAPDDFRSHEMAAVLAYLQDSHERYFNHLVQNTYYG